MSGEIAEEQLIAEIKKAVTSCSDESNKNKTVNHDLQDEITKWQTKTFAIKKKQDDLKESIKELLSMAETESSHLEDVKKKSLEPQKRKLKSDIGKTEKEQEDLDKELLDVTKTITHKKEVLKDMQNRANFSQQETSTSIHRIRAEYSFFSQLFNIKWDHNTLDDHIKGFVLKPTEKRVVPFKFDKTSHSQFFITNYLWEQISMGSDMVHTTIEG